MQLLSKAWVFFWVTTILVSSTCFGLDVHYCQGEAQTFGIYDTAKPCNMHEKNPDKKEVHACCKARKVVEKQPQHGFPVAENGKCCYNDQVAFKTDGETQQSGVELQTVPVEKSSHFSEEYLASSWNNFAITNPPFRGPPEATFRYNFQIFFQVFRI